MVYIFKNFPLPASMHPQAQIAAEAVECAGRQAKFWPMHDQVFLNQAEWSGKSNALNVLLGYGAKVGVPDEGAYKTCLSEHQTAQKVQDDYNFGKSIGVPATPAFVVAGRGMTGAQPIETFRQVIDAALGVGQPAPTKAP